ncbi:MAG: FimV family protein [Woeseiaceae bacterium]
MNASKGNNKENRKKAKVTAKSRNKQLLPALIAVGGACSMMTVPASALELGELKIDSALGQPLRASIAYALNPHEELYDFCIYLRPGLAASGLPALTQANIAVADGVILLTGSQAVREPLLTMQVTIDCPYTVHLSREYMLMLNPPGSVPAAVAAVESSEAPTQAKESATQATKPRPRVEPSTTVDSSPIPESSRYLVQRGDTLSEIASRIQNRSIALWPAVDRIFTANPDAFIDSDVNRLRAGTWLEIPDLSVAAPESVVAQAAPPEPIDQAGESQAYAGYEPTAAAEMPDTEQPTPDEVSEALAPPVSEADTSAPDFADLQPGDVVVGDESPFVSPIGSPAEADTSESIFIPDTEIVEPGEVQPVAVVEPSQGDKTGGSWSWLMWLGGTGLALILGLLLFGQKIRQRFGSVGIAAPLEPMPERRKTDKPAQGSAVVADVDFEVPDTAPQSSSITLDADFDDGTGLDVGSDIDVAQDFGFSASNAFDEELDMELPETAAAQDEKPETDIIPPPEREDPASILDSEVPPSEEDGEYDFSMIVDATKQNLDPSDATTKDLQAVPVEIGANADAEDYTLSQEVDYKILEQDYEDEYTATQALNEEIEKAAAELANRMDSDMSREMTTGLPRNTLAENDESGALDDTGLNEEVTANMPSGDDEVTVELPSTDDDITAEMEVESGTIDTKKKKKAS